ncbi:NAD(P)/FAD-dependent oxidoreductase [Polymorphobacter arshaanensis]|uniref:NAD(P)/FAD-dependent oxidoreductase n=1 Tax=Glacieibacterium arshaanense TaxID=2511025 RepID=A0A4Y9ERI2_9SPHN|nr:NAD(P)/FAD-dependent oxidoreductase [Polymorphobacter arshaanensis]TFU05950.1 NAD(P)/FAD-dependent oxidoreductase [Polymorphobacter arshaanensis]
MATDKAAILEKYRAERDKRLREDGNDQYLETTGQFAHYLDDPYTPRVERPPVTDHVTFAMVGGGFAGLCVGARLAEAGITDVRLIDKAGDFGGNWYWNRYPGAQCDTASIIYLPLLEETGHMPTEKYAHAPEILEQSRRIGRTFGLYDKALFHTRVTDMVWEEDKGVWRITTDRGDSFTADYIGMGTGPLHVPKLPGIPGIDTFKGHSFHTSRWDYDYTGGDTFGAPLDKLKDKRVAIIGTGATAVQCVPHLARAGGTVYVVQRTPSSIDVRANEPIDPEWFKTVATPGWQKRWLDNFARNVGMGGAAEDWVKDGWTDLTRRIRAKVMNLPPEQMNPAGMMAAYEDADIEKMSEIRARAEAIVEDKETAEKLKAWYRQLCKRPCFHDAYLQAFNEPNTHLIDTDGKGVERIDETGFWVGGKHYDVDCIIYASGFEVGTSHQRRAGFDIAGVGGKRLSEAWSDGMRTLHGLHVNGFPNAFVVQVAQAANYIVNVPHNWSDAGETIATIVRHAIDTGAKKVDVLPEAQKKWVEFVLTSPGGMAGIAPDCTPGYYNNEGKGYQESALFGAGHPAGAVAFFSYIDDWRKSGKFEGLTFN